MSQEESKASRREEFVRAYLNDVISNTFQGVSELNEELAGTVLKETCKSCVSSWLAFIKHNYGYDPEKPDLDAFLVVEEKTQNRISDGKFSISRQGNVITEVLTPGQCSCPLVKEHKLVKPFPNLCKCAENGIKMLWEAALKRPVKMEVTEAYNRGGNSCTMRIELL